MKSKPSRKNRMKTQQQVGINGRWIGKGEETGNMFKKGVDHMERLYDKKRKMLS